LKPRILTHLAVFVLLAAACRPLNTLTATPSKPLQLALKSPALGEAVDASPFLQWVEFPGATHYQVTVLDGSAEVILQKDTTYTLLRVIPPLPKGASYDWNVQAQDANHAVLADLNSRFSVKADLLLVWPPAGEAVDSNPVLQWQAFAGAVRYQVVIVVDQAEPAQIVMDEISRETNYAVSQPLKPGSYRWTVRALDGNQVVLAELNSRFSVKDRLEVLDPVDGAQVRATPIIQWAVYKDVIQYQVLIINTDAYPPEVAFDRIGKGTEMFIDTPLKPETAYSLTIRARKGGKVVAESNTTFTVYATEALSTCTNVKTLPAAECEVLVTFYHQTSGPTWADSADWLANNAPCEWSGVTCTDGHVTDLNLYSKDIKGSVPSSLAELTDLRVLALRDNQLTGPIPPELAGLKHLVFLDLSHNQLSGSLAVELGQLDTLELVSLNDNQLSGELPRTWATLAGLRHLDLRSNALTGAIPAEWGQLAQLEVLRLGHNQLSGNIPDEIGQLAHLTELDLSYNQLNGAVPAPILALPYRALWGNQLDGTIQCDGAPPMAIDFQSIQFICFSSLAASVWPEVLPAIPVQENAPFWDARPEHVRFTFAGAPGALLRNPLSAALSDQAQVLIYPAHDFEALDRHIRLKVSDLLKLLADRPATIEGELPLLPLNNAGQVLHARVHYLDFENGSGVSFLTQNAMGLSAINNQELFYTFQGLTDDRAYYVAIFFPVTLPALPATGQLSEDEFANLMANYQAYLADTTTLLDSSAPETFAPDLTQVDRLIETLTVHGGNP
jgi:Leucine-rich repeat (LRR) protein